MEGLTLCSAAAFPPEVLAALLNRAYVDYPIPIRLSPRGFARMAEDIDVDLTHSVVTLAEGVPVGLALLSCRGEEGWISGVGVVPQWRRHGLGRRMIARLQASARQRGMRRVRLEVLAQNRVARALYETQGFVFAREFLVLQRDPDAGEPRPAAPPVVHVDASWLLEALWHFHRILPSWQRDRPTLRRRLAHLSGLAYVENGVPLGYVLYQTQPYLVVVTDLAVDPGYGGRETMALALLRAVHGLYPYHAGYVVNVPVEDPLAQAFFEVGYHVWQRQHEMVWHPRS